jgi:4-amino-4-deoxy-L-arabinose transferase-like glycosyltransferase
VASVWILFHIVRRRFSASAALLAAFFLAIMPVGVAVNRTNNTDSCLLVALLLAAWVFMRAVEEGRRRLLLASMALIGLAFNIKMLAAFIIVPTLFLVYFLAAPKRWTARLLDLTLAGVVLLASSASWVLACELTAPEHRPFVGSSRHNSMLELVVGHNGIGRFVSRVKPAEPAVDGGAAATQDPDATEPRPRSVLARLFVHAPTGPLRLADGQLLAQVGWWLPIGIMALLIGAFQSRLRRPFTPERLALLFWFSWIINYGVVYSYAGGIMHFYYRTTMAPALAALTGIGVVSLWEAHRQGGWHAALLPATLLGTALWEFRIQAHALGWTFRTFGEPAGQWLRGLHLVLIGGTLVACAALTLGCCIRFSPRLSRWLSAGALGTGLVALLAVPLAWTLSSVLVAGHGVLPSADLYRLDPAIRDAGTRGGTRFGKSADTSKLVGFLRANRQGERYLLATSTTQLAAPIIIETGEAVMARGGFHGLDPAVTPDSLAQWVRTHQVRFAMLGDVASISRRMGADTAGLPVADWIRANGRLVPPGLWRRRHGGSSLELYDLRPGDGWASGPEG